MCYITDFVCNEVIEILIVPNEQEGQRQVTCMSDEALALYWYQSQCYLLVWIDINQISELIYCMTGGILLVARTAVLKARRQHWCFDSGDNFDVLIQATTLMFWFKWLSTLHKQQLVLWWWHICLISHEPYT